MPDARGQRAPLCDDCRDAVAWEVVTMRTKQGMTLRAIADRLGYGSSITTVTNLMKTVVVIDSRMGRPRNEHIASSLQRAITQ